jgi:glutathione-regulated potassium-efflux system ancillary protein KefF
MAHPALSRSRVNAALLQAARQVEGTEVLDLYGTYPDYSIDIAAEQAALERAQRLVLVYPVHWYGMPALLKLWVDEVFQVGWAYGPGTSALQGKTLLTVVSTGGALDDYQPDAAHAAPFEAYLPAVRQFARYCGMGFETPMVLHGAHGVEADKLAQHAKAFQDRLAALPLMDKSPPA